MTFLAEQLEQIDRQLAGVLVSGEDPQLGTDGDLVQVLHTLGQIQRRIDGAIVSATDGVVQRDQGERSTRLSTRAGYRDAAELLRRALRVDGYTARRYVTAATAVHREVNITSGDLLPGAFPALTAALTAGELSVTGFLACVVPLQKAARIGAADRLAADAVLARFACGRPLGGAGAEEGDTAPAPTTDELSAMAAHIVARLDPDGAEPSDRAGKRRRFFMIGKLRDGSVPVRGELLPEVAAQLQKLVDSLTNPKAEDNSTGSTVRFRLSDNTGDGDRRDYDSDCSGNDTGGGASDAEFDAKYSTSGTEYGPAPGSDRVDGLEPHKAAPPPEDAADLRTHAQKRHDALATVLMVAAASGGMPTLGGAAPTQVVSVTAADYAHHTGRATVEGAGYDAPLGAAAHAACAGGVQRVLFDEHGAIVAISTTARIFNARQRRAIVIRDRKCLIPGCEIRAEWCEIHHVIDNALGGPTHTSNGVPLCFHHHRTLDEGVWLIRMRDGMPEILGPTWWDPFARWRSPHLDYTAADHALDTERDREPEPAGDAWQ